MASPSSSSSSSSTLSYTLPNYSQFPSLKLDEGNYMMWESLVVPILKSHDLLGIVDGSEPCPSQFTKDDEGKDIPNPDYAVWTKKDQFLLSWINISLSETILPTVYGLQTSQQVWTNLAHQFASESKARVSQLKRQLQSLTQGSKSCAAYLRSAKAIADQLAAIQKPVSDEDLISFIISGLNPTFNTFVTVFTVTTRDKSPSFADFQDEILNHEVLLTQQQQSAPDPSNFAFFSNTTSKPSPQTFNRRGRSPSQQNRPFGRYGPPRGSPSSRGFSGYHQNMSSHFQSPRPYQNAHFSTQQFTAPRFSSATTGRQQHNFSNNTGASYNPRIPCQICGKLNHSALDCFHRMDFSFQGRHPPPQLAAMTAQTNPDLDEQQWFADSGANAHVTTELENLTVQPQPFQGTDSVAVGNGAGLAIEHTGSATFLSTSPLSNSSFHLKHMLHCPSAATNLLSIQKLCQDNNCYFILTATHFCVKDLKTHALLLEGRSENGLYPLKLRRCSLKRTPTFTAFLGLKTSICIWHSRLGHPSFKTVNHVIKANSLPTLQSNENPVVFCDFCPLGKSKQLPFHSSTRITTHVLELIHTDLWTSPIYSLSGCKYYIIFVDDFTRYTWFYPLHHKSDTYSCFVKFKTLVETQFSRKIQQLQSDGGGEYTSNIFQSFLTTHGILHRKSCPHTSQQNGLAERKLRHILETGLTLLAQSGLSKHHWVDAFLTSVFIINRLPTPVLNHISPFEKLFLKSPDYTILRVFGCKCFPLLRPYNSNKLQFRSKTCIFLGYSSAGYRCLDPITNRVYLSRNVVFDEHSFPAREKEANSPLSSRINAESRDLFTLPVSVFSPASSTDPDTLPLSLAEIPLTTSTSPAVSGPTHQDFQQPSSPLCSDIIATPQGSPTDQHHHISPAEPVPSVTPESAPPTISSHPMLTRSRATAASVPSSEIISSTAPPPHLMVTRSRTGSLKPKPFPDYKLYHSTKHPPPMALLTVLTESEPTTFAKAILDHRWQSAMAAEFAALQANHTWTLCPRPFHRHVIRNKWVYKIKQLADGSIDRFKARLVAKGFEQKNGIDYTETFSPVVKSSTVRIVLTLAVQFAWPIKQLDISNAFLHGTLQEEVYMEQPPGFLDAAHPDFVCKLHKSIYGLKQAPRAWFHCLSTVLLDFGFTPSRVDTSLFSFMRDHIIIILLVYVDDILVTGNNISAIHSLITMLQTQFPVKDLGDLGYFLGIKATRTADSLHLNQAKYIADLLQRTHMLGAKPTATPCSSVIKLSKFDTDLLPDPTEYRQVVGALQYCTLTRPDISFSVNQLCQHMHNPSATHWSATKRVLRYLKHTPDHGLLISKGPLNLQAFCDSDWAGNPDDRRSTSGFCIFLGSSLISWSSKKQNVVSRSSTEAEYRSLAHTTAELFWIRMLLKELHVFLPTPPILWCDNVIALALASNPVFHARTKYIEVDYYFIREKVLNGDIVLQFISTLNQAADIFTKDLPSSRFAQLRAKLRVLPSTLSLREAIRRTPSAGAAMTVPAGALPADCSIAHTATTSTAECSDSITSNGHIV